MLESVCSESGQNLWVTDRHAPASGFNLWNHSGRGESFEIGVTVRICLFRKWSKHVGDGLPCTSLWFQFMKPRWSWKYDNCDVHWYTPKHDSVFSPWTQPRPCRHEVKQLVMSRYRNFATIRYQDMASIHGTIHYDTDHQWSSKSYGIIGSVYDVFKNWEGKYPVNVFSCQYMSGWPWINAYNLYIPHLTYHLLQVRWQYYGMETASTTCLGWVISPSYCN